MKKIDWICLLIGLSILAVACCWLQRQWIHGKYWEVRAQITGEEQPAPGVDDEY